MKRFILIVLSLCLVPLVADAQWYLFPGKGRKNKQEQVVAPKLDTTTIEQAPISLPTRDIVVGDEYFPRSASVSLILPINASSSQASKNFLEMYSGALLAVKDIGERGYKIELNVIDSECDDFLNYSAIQSSDLIIGPVKASELDQIYTQYAYGKTMISPLDPKAAELLDSINIIQAPVPWNRQIDELLDWICENPKANEEIIIIRDYYAADNKSSYIVNGLKQRAIPFTAVGDMSELELSADKQYRFIIATDSDSFLAGAARGVAIEAAKKSTAGVSLYCTSQIRTIIGANVSDLYDANAHITAAYHIDYDDEKVKRFILAYRALYHKEPGSFAFQGYDIMHYFVNAYYQLGRNWNKKLPEYSESGLQSDFRFLREESYGKVNTAVRRVIYNSDYSTTLIQ